MTTVDFITALFYEVDEQLGAIPKHPALNLSEFVEGRRWPTCERGGLAEARVFSGN
jgi:hypothetical protein